MSDLSVLCWIAFFVLGLLLVCSVYSTRRRFEPAAYRPDKASGQCLSASVHVSDFRYAFNGITAHVLYRIEEGDTAENDSRGDHMCQKYSLEVFSV